MYDPEVAITSTIPTRGSMYDPEVAATSTAPTRGMK